MSRKLSSGFITNEYTFTEEQLRAFCHYIANTMYHVFTPTFKTYPSKEIIEVIDYILKEDYGLGQTTSY